MSYIMGYIVYATLVDNPLLLIYTLAFTITQMVRLTLAVEAAFLDRAGVDIEHPAVVLVMASLTALVAATVVSLALLQ